jgi:hypothetical protein
MARNPDSRRCHVPGCLGWATHGSNPPTCVPHSGRITGAGAPRGQRKPRTQTFDAQVPDAQYLVECSARRGWLLREERARLCAAMDDAKQVLHPDAPRVSVAEGLRIVGLLLLAARAAVWLAFARPAAPEAHKEKLDDAVDTLLDDYTQPPRRSR